MGVFLCIFTHKDLIPFIATAENSAAREKWQVSSRINLLNCLWSKINDRINSGGIYPWKGLSGMGQGGLESPRKDWRWPELGTRWGLSTGWTWIFHPQWFQDSWCSRGQILAWTGTLCESQNISGDKTAEMDKRCLRKSMFREEAKWERPDPAQPHPRLQLRLLNTFLHFQDISELQWSVNVVASPLAFSLKRGLFYVWTNAALLCFLRWILYLLFPKMIWFSPLLPDTSDCNKLIQNRTKKQKAEHADNVHLVCIYRFKMCFNWFTTNIL